MSRKYREPLYTILSLLPSLSNYWHLVLVWHIYYHGWANIDTLLLTLEFTVLYSTNFDKCITTCIYCYSNIQNSFIALEMPCTLPIHPSPEPWQPLIFFIICIVLSFSRISYGWKWSFQFAFVHLAAVIQIAPCLFSAR